MDILRHELDDEQFAIATRSDRSCLVLAGPGSGKTRLLTNVAAYQIRKSPEAHWRVLCLTFSVEATSEMRRRLDSPKLGVSRSRRINVANFHQLGGQILHAYADQLGWPRDCQLIGDGSEQIEEVVGRLNLGYDVNIPSLVGAIERLRNARPVAGAPVPAALLGRIAEAYEAMKRERGQWDYNDLIIRTVELLDVAPRVLSVLRTMYRYIVIDELQDTSGNQLELVARLAGEGETPVFGVADDDQMIYAWRDARPENIKEFQSRFGAREEYLVGNYRCPPRVVQAANAIIAPVRPQGLREAESRVEGIVGEVLVDAAPLFTDHPAQVARVVRAELDAGAAPECVAILSAVQFKFRDLKPALETAGVPFVHIGDRALASEPLVRLLLAALSCQQRSDARAVGRFSRTIVDVLGIVDDDEVRELAERLTAPETPDRVLTEVADVLGATRGSALETHVRRIVHEATRESARQSRQHAATSTLIEWNRLDARIRREDRSVKLMTTFGAKGLEFDVVVLPYFQEGLAPYTPRGRTVDMAEERRKLYVAITRARHRVVFTYAGVPSAFLAELNGISAPWRAPAAGSTPT
ncbi:MAG TPA: ATP-dependent helicase [Candidatus Limnocylindrales bacterium]